MSDVRERLERVLRDTFFDDDLVLRDDLSADDIEGWDSLQHVNVIVAVEKEFGIRFATREISRLKEPGETLGSLITQVEQKLGVSPDPGDQS